MPRHLLCSAILVLVAAGSAFGQTYSESVQKARALYEERRFEESARQYTEAFEIEAGSANDHYDAGCSWALAGDADAALAELEKAVASGYRNADWLASDEDLVTLHAHPRWESILASCQDAQEAYLGTINRELHDLFQADQSDRSGDVDWNVVEPRDEARRLRVQEMIDADLLKARDDFIHAAFIFQHGGDSTAYAMAHDLAMQAVAIDSTSLRARWIAAASKDRHLMSVGKPQIYGTQYMRSEDGPWTQAPYDSTAISDEERARWGVPSLAEQRARLQRYNQ